jgi:hypothetical protein
MKPDWKEDAPCWARYLAMDYHGEWHWFEAKPQMGRSGWWISSGRYLRANHDDWRSTLEERPVCKGAGE